MPTSARCWDFDRPSVGADDLTDAPNFGTKFDWRRPCLRYNRSWHGFAVTEGLPGVDGPFGGDLCLALLSARALFHANSRWFLNTSPPRVGADLCVRPNTPLRGIRARADTQVGPHKTSIKPKTTGGDRAPPLPVDRGPQRRAEVRQRLVRCRTLFAPKRSTRPLRQCRRGLVPSCRREDGTGRSLAPMFLGTLGRIVFYCRLKKNPSTRMPSSTTRKAWGSTSWTTWRSSSTSYLERQTQSTWTFSPV